MRIVAGTPEAYKYNLVWHVPLCKALNNVKWVDDETQEYCTFKLGYCTFKLGHLNYRSGLGVVELRTHQAKKIEIRPRERVIFIDPIEGLDQEALLRELDKTEGLTKELQELA